MWRFHSYFEPVGEAQGIKRAVKLTTEGVNGAMNNYHGHLWFHALYWDLHYFNPLLRSQTSKVIIHSHNSTHANIHQCHLTV